MKWLEASSKQFQVPTFYVMMCAIASHQLISAFLHPTMWILWVRDQIFDSIQSSRHCGTWRYRTSGVLIWWEYYVDDVNWPDQNRIWWCWILWTNFMAWELLKFRQFLCEAVLTGLIHWSSTESVDLIRNALQSLLIYCKPNVRPRNLFSELQLWRGSRRTTFKEFKNSDNR